MNDLELKLQEKPLDIIIKDATEAYPEECCGFLYGEADKDHREVLEAVPVQNRNEENKGRRFEVSPADYMRAEQYADENGLELLGIYHSHPDHLARPSEFDRKKALPWFSYLIVSVEKGVSKDITSWRLDGDHHFKEEHLTGNERSLSAS